MISGKKRTQLSLVVVGILIVAFAGSVAALLSIPRYRWRVHIARLKATGSLPDITWKELEHLNQHGDPFNLKGLETTRSSYLSIKNPFASTADVSAGESLFKSNCSFCHGGNGIGGRSGPTLKQRQMVRGSSEWALFKTISNGIEGTGMPPSSLPENDRWKLVAYVKSLAVGEEQHSDSPFSARIAGIAPVRYQDILASDQDRHQWLTYSRFL